MDKNQLLEKVKSGSLKDRTGEIYSTKEGYKITIIEYISAMNCIILFNDTNNTILKNIQYSHIKEGAVRNPFHPSVCGVGYLGIGVFTKHNNSKANKLYKTWSGMIKRCYSKNTQEKQPSYKDVTVCKEWHNFQNFAQWYEENYNTKTMQGWHLDKDIICPDCKIYSPETCCFVPSEINSLFVKNNINRGCLPIGVSFHKKIKKYSVNINKKSSRVHLGYYVSIKEAFQAYKEVKENYIKEVANKWKELISDKVYEVMYNYQVKITD